MTTTDRLALVDAAIAGHRACYLAAVWLDRMDEAGYHLTECGRLERLRVRVEAGPLTATLEETTP